MCCATGLKSPLPIWEKVSRRAQRYSIVRLKEIYQSLLETDLAIKTGRFEGDLALNLLVAELCSRGDVKETADDYRRA